MRKETLQLTLIEIRALGICCMIARDTGGLAAFGQTLESDEEAALVAGMHAALVKLSDAEDRFPETTPATPQERLDVAAAKAAVDQEQAWLVDPRRGDDG